MTKRKAMTAARRVRIFEAAGGVCHICGVKIQPGELWEAEHVKPLWLGGEDEDGNLAPAHVHCHAGKTKEEAPMRAKSNRVKARHLGAIRPKGTIKSRGFAKKERVPKKSLPPRRIYE